MKDNTKFEIWLIRIMHRTAWKMLGSKNTEVPDAICTTAEKSDGSDCLSSVLVSEQNLVISRSMERLHKKYREVLILYYFNELSVGEIARIVGCFEGTVKSRLYKARALTKKRLEFQNEKETLFHAERESV